MAKLPRRPDPARLLATEADVRTLERGTRLHRIYSRGGDHPTRWNAFRSFGPLRSRFDHHLVDPDGNPYAQERSILYAALDLPSAFAEVFQAERRIDRRRRAPWLASFDVGMPLRLLDLCGGFPLRAGASMKLMTDSVMTAQRWSRGFHETWPEIDGVVYPSSLTGRPCVALYERAESGITASCVLRLHRALDDEALHGALVVAAETIGYTIV